MASDTAITQPENQGGGDVRGGVSLKRTWDLAFADEQDSSLAAHLGNIPIEALQYLRAKIAKGDGSTEEMLARVIDHNSNIMEAGEEGRTQENQEPTPSTSTQVQKPPQTEQAGGSKDDGIITLDEGDEDNNTEGRTESPLAFFATFDTLQSLFPDLSPAFLQVKY